MYSSAFSSTASAIPATLPTTSSATPSAILPVFRAYREMSLRVFLPDCGANSRAAPAPRIAPASTSIAPITTPSFLSSMATSGFVSRLPGIWK